MEERHCIDLCVRGGGYEINVYRNGGGYGGGMGGSKATIKIAMQIRLEIL